MTRSRSSYTPVEGQGGAAAAEEESPEAEEARKLRRKLEKKLKPSTPGPRTRLIEASIVGRRRTVKELLQVRPSLNGVKRNSGPSEDGPDTRFGGLGRG